MTTTCSIEGCDKPAKTRGWCKLHYMRWYKHGDPLTLMRGGRPHNPEQGWCAIAGCLKPGPYTKGLCGMHYMRQYKYGDPLTVMAKPGRKPIAVECEIDGCERRGPYVRGLCKLHYTRWEAHGDPLWEPSPYIKPNCSVDGCEKPAFARTFCTMHYHRYMESGDVGEAAPRRADAGQGSTDELGYRRVTVDGRKIKEHRYVMEQVIGRPLLPNESVHHVNGDRKDNRPENLELWTGMHGNGQRVEDLVRFVVTNYPDEVRKVQSEL